MATRTVQMVYTYTPTAYQEAWSPLTRYWDVTKAQIVIPVDWMSYHSILSGEHIIGIHVQFAGTLAGDIGPFRIRVCKTGERRVNSVASFVTQGSTGDPLTLLYQRDLITPTDITDGQWLYCPFNQGNEYFTHDGTSSWIIELSQENAGQLGTSTSSGHYHVSINSSQTGYFTVLGGYDTKNDAGDFPFATNPTPSYSATSRIITVALEVTDTLPSTAPILTATQNDQAISLSWTYP